MHDTDSPMFRGCDHREPEYGLPHAWLYARDAESLAYQGITDAHSSRPIHSLGQLLSSVDRHGFSGMAPPHSAIPHLNPSKHAKIVKLRYYLSSLAMYIDHAYIST